MRIANFFLTLLIAIAVHALSGGETTINELKDSERLQSAIEPEYEVSILYLYDKEFREKDIHNKLVELSKKLEGFVQFYSVKCSDFTNLTYCSETEQRPLLVINRPPDYKVNPYTNKPMETQHMKFVKDLLKNVTVDRLSTLVLSALPDYAHRLEPDTIAQLQLMKYMNKVLLFTAKDQSPPMFRALSAKYKNRLLFGMVSHKDKELAMEYKVKNFPQVLVEESINHTTGEILPTPKVHYYKGEVKLAKIEEFIKQFATAKRLSEIEMTQIFRKAIEEEKNKVPVLIPVTSANISSVFSLTDTAIVYVSRSPTVPSTVKEITDKLKYYFSLMIPYRHAIPSFFFHASQTISKGELDTLLGDKETEQFILYPYGVKSKKENSKPIKITDHTIEDIEAAVPDKSILLLNGTFETVMNDVLATQKKVLSVYFGKEEKVNLAYKLLTSNEELKQNIVFATYIDPPQHLLSSFSLTYNDLPRIGGLMPGTMGKGGQYQHPAFLYPSTKPSYIELVEFFKAIVDRAQNKTTQEPTVRRKKGGLEVVELNSTQDFKEYCVDRTSICFIALLQAEIGDKGAKKLEEQLQILRTVRQKKENSPMEIMWINATCHKELLKTFELEEMAIPTVVIYAPKKKVGGNMVGKFDLESVQDYVEGVFIGKTRGLRKIEATPEIKDIDCSSIKQTEGEALSEEERKMLDEIIKEEERKKKELEKEIGGKSKGKKKRPAKKKKDL